MNNSTNQNFSIFREKNAENQDPTNVTRAMQYDGTNSDAIDNMCNNFTKDSNSPVLTEGDCVIEHPSNIPRTFSVMKDVEFVELYEEVDASGILHGGTCDHA